MAAFFTFGEPVGVVEDEDEPEEELLDKVLPLGTDFFTKSPFYPLLFLEVVSLAAFLDFWSPLILPFSAATLSSSSFVSSFGCFFLPLD